MKRYVIRCADFTCFLSSQARDMDAGLKLPIGTVGICLYNSDLAEIGVSVTGKYHKDREYVYAIISHLFASVYGYPLGVYSVLFGGEPSCLEIADEDRENCGIKMKKCEELFTKTYSLQDGIVAEASDIVCDGVRTRVLPACDCGSVCRERLRSLVTCGSGLSADVCIAVSVRGSYATVRCPCYPIPSSVIRALSYYLRGRFDEVNMIVDEFTSTVYHLQDGRIILPFWRGEAI